MNNKNPLNSPQESVNKDSESNMSLPNSSAVSEEMAPKKDFWDKFAIVSRPMAAFFTAMVIALIGYFGQSILTDISNKEQKALTELSLQEQNARLYTELLARREDAESSLRKDMFTQIMGGFFKNLNSEDIENDLSKKVLKLELLAINFGDSLSLGPLFSEMSRDIERELEGKLVDWYTVAAKYQKRLRSLAKRVASSQLSTIFPSAKTFSFEVPVDLVEAESMNSEPADFTYEWPTDADNTGDEKNIVELDGVKREFKISFKNVDEEQQSVQVKLVISDFVKEEIIGDNGQQEVYEYPEKVTDLEFTLDFFNFPLIDNTRLSHNQRFTLILEKFDINTFKLVGMVFPGLYASQRDKPFLNEAIQELSDQREEGANLEAETKPPIE